MLLLLACGTDTPAERIEPSFIEVTLDATVLGTAKDPLPFPTSAQSWPVTVRTLDKDQALYPFNGDLTLSVRPGRVPGYPLIRVEDGTWSGTVPIEAAFGPTRIWVSDEGDEDIDSTRLASWATGVSDEIWYQFPTIGELQATDDPATNAVDGEFAEILVEGREVIVTALTTNGFWAADVMDEPGSGNAIFVYTFSKPDDEYVPGRSLSLLTGIDQEYLETTQIYWPTLAAGEAEYPVPDAIPLDAETACDPEAMELLESSRVDVLSWQIPDSFTASSSDYADYEEYGQWPLLLGSCTIYVESGGAVPSFYPLDFAGQTLPRVSGMVKQVFGSAVIIVLDEADIEVPAGGPPPPSALRASPPSSSRADWLRTPGP